MATTKPSPVAPFQTTWWQWIEYYYLLMLHGGFPFFWWIRPHWKPSQMGDKRGTVVFITGGNSGTGYETAREYYLHGATVYIGCRSDQRATEAIARIKKGGRCNMYGEFEYETPNAAKVGTIEYINMDLSDLDSVERCANELKGKVQRLDMLFANAGIMATDPGQFTKQGYPLQFGTNTLGHQRLISLLLPLLKQTSRETPDSPARLISLSSVGHVFAPRGGINYEAIESRTELDKWAAYGESKWGDIALANFVNTHHGPGSPNAIDGEIITFSVHPGVVATNLSRHLGGVEAMYKLTWLTPLYQLQPYDGALNQIWCGEVSVAEARRMSGSFISCFQTQCPARPDLKNKVAVDRMWEWCDAQARKTE